MLAHGGGHGAAKSNRPAIRLAASMSIVITHHGENGSYRDSTVCQSDYLLSCISLRQVPNRSAVTTLLIVTIQIEA